MCVNDDKNRIRKLKTDRGRECRGLFFKQELKKKKVYGTIPTERAGLEKCLGKEDVVENYTVFDWIVQNAVAFWLLVIVVLLVFELLTLGLTTIWFTFGGLIAMAIAAADGPFAFQFAAFVVISLLAMVLVRNVALERFNQNRARTNVDSVLGQKAIVTQKINNLKSEGQVVLNGMEWTARSTTDAEIEMGAVVVVKRVSGVKLIVEKEG